MNKVILIGNVTRDPEIRTVNDTIVASLGLATNKRFKDKQGNKKEAVEFHNLTAWRGLAEVISKYVKKGHKLAVEGEIKYRTYEKDGQTHYRTEILLTDMTMLTSKGKAEGSGLPNPQDYSTEDGIRIEDIPFS